jgi:hypothetical protein
MCIRVRIGIVHIGIVQTGIITARIAAITAGIIAVTELRQVE